MDISDWVALLSFLGALLSALYARWIFSEAKKSNQISVHIHQKEIFNSFIDFRGEFLQLGEQVSNEKLYKLATSAYTSDFYLPEELANRLKEYSNLAQKIHLEYNKSKVYEMQNRDLPNGLMDGIFTKIDSCHLLDNEIESELRNILTLEKP